MTNDHHLHDRTSGVSVEITITDHAFEETATVTQTIGEKEIEGSDATDTIGRSTEFALKLALEEGGVFDQRDFPTTYTSEPGTLAAELEAWRDDDDGPVPGYAPAPRIIDPPSAPLSGTPVFEPGSEEVETDPASPRFGMPVFTPGSATSEAIRTVAEAAADYTVSGSPTGEVKITATDEDGETIVDAPISEIEVDVDSSDLRGAGTGISERFLTTPDPEEGISTAHKPFNPETELHPRGVGSPVLPEFDEIEPEPDWRDVTRYANWLLDGAGGGVEPEMIAAQVPEGVNVATHSLDAAEDHGATKVEVQPEPTAIAGSVDAGVTLDRLSRLVPPVENWEVDPPEVRGAAASAEAPIMTAAYDVDWADVASFTDWLLKHTDAGIRPEMVAEEAPAGVRVDTWDKIDGTFHVQIAPDHDHEYTPTAAETLDTIAGLTPAPSTWERDPPDGALSSPRVDPEERRPTAEEHARGFSDAIDRMRADETEGDDS